MIMHYKSQIEKLNKIILTRAVKQQNHWKEYFSYGNMHLSTRNNGNEKR
uniref:Uncharacterized protein n=1 Tax=Arundo donax TaxID=35708 RepID=A0A0A8ZR79_ARUDO